MNLPGPKKILGKSRLFGERQWRGWVEVERPQLELTRYRMVLERFPISKNKVRRTEEEKEEQVFLD